MNDEPKEYRFRLRLHPSTVERLKKIAARERRDGVAGVIELAAEEISDRGHTDVVVVKARI
jgi:hypothetical protein